MRQEIRSSDVFLKEDVRGMLQAILATNEELARQFADPQVQTYRHGFAAAVVAVAVAFNIELQPPAGRGALPLEVRP